MPPKSEHWHVERGIPLVGIATVIIVVMGQTLTAVWFAAKMDARVEAVEKFSITEAPMADRMTRVEVKIDGMDERVKDILQRISISKPERN